VYKIRLFRRVIWSKRWSYWTLRTENSKKGRKTSKSSI